MKIPLRRLLLTLLPPVGAALAATALIDFAAYSRFVRSINPSEWVASSPVSETLTGFDIAATVVLVAALLCFGATRLVRSPTTRALGWLALSAGAAGPLWVAHETRTHLLFVRLDTTVTHCDMLLGAGTRASLALGALGAALAAAMLIAGWRSRSGEWVLGLVTGIAVVALTTVLWVVPPTNYLLDSAFEADSNAALESATNIHQWGVWGILALAAIVLVGRLRAGRQVQTRGAVVACCLGALAFVATRSLAHDARNVLPVVADESSVHRGEVATPLERCEPGLHFCAGSS